MKNNQIKGAALDVFHHEPLNSKSELFNLENVFLSPHISGNYKEYQNKVIDVFSNNLIKFKVKRHECINTIRIIEYI